MKHPLRAGLFSIGLSAYWPQFSGLLDRLNGYNRRIEDGLRRDGVEIVNLGMIDTPEKGLDAGHQLRASDVDILFLHVSTYALSSTVLSAVRRAKVPVILLNLSPEAAIDYPAFNRMPSRTEKTGEWLAFCGTCPVPELANVFHRTGVQFAEVTGTLEDEAAWREIGEWMDAAVVAHALAHNRLGLMGHYYGGMLDVATDLTRLSGVFGSHLEMIEPDELSALRQCVTEAEIEGQFATFASSFDVQADCSPAELRRAAMTAAALDRLAAAHDLSSLAYYASGSGNPGNEETMSSIILGASLLTARGIPAAGEYEVKNAIAMKMMDAFGAGGSFTEFYAVDFNAGEVLMGHDGPGHPAIAEGKPKVRPLREYHGKAGQGLSIEMSVKHGPITMLSVVEEERAGYKLLIAEGESVPGQILEIGNTNSRYRFAPGARAFLKQWNSHGPAHHCAAGVGHLAARLEKLAVLLRVPAVRVC
ncbi:MAG TPA: arabinose isomerase [Acidobacteriaceae bacterium]|nr:arabinose isomerase [Acidobacteriaceae bacterium]